METPRRAWFLKGSSTQRRKRGSTQRILLIDQTKKTDEMVGEMITYSILGTTDKVYDVLFPRNAQSCPEQWDTEDFATNVWSCSCPDYTMRHNQCKHIYFVQDKVLEQVSEEERWELALKKIEDSQKTHDEYMASLEVMEEYKIKKMEKEKRGKEEVENRGKEETENRGKEEVEKLSNVIRQKKWEEEDCAICFEKMIRGENVVWCTSSCGQTIHQACFYRWCRQKNAESCVYCRATMSAPPPPEPLKKKQKSKEQPVDYISIDTTSKNARRKPPIHKRMDDIPKDTTEINNNRLFQIPKEEDPMASFL